LFVSYLVINGLRGSSISAKERFYSLESDKR